MQAVSSSSAPQSVAVTVSSVSASSRGPVPTTPTRFEAKGASPPPSLDPLSHPTRGDIDAQHLLVPPAVIRWTLVDGKRSETGGQPLVFTPLHEVAYQSEWKFSEAGRRWFAELQQASKAGDSAKIIDLLAQGWTHVTACLSPATEKLLQCLRDSVSDIFSTPLLESMKKATDELEKAVRFAIVDEQASAAVNFLAKWITLLNSDAFVKRLVFQCSPEESLKLHREFQALRSDQADKIAGLLKKPLLKDAEPALRKQLDAIQAECKTSTETKRPPSPVPMSFQLDKGRMTKLSFPRDVDESQYPVSLVSYLCDDGVARKLVLKHVVDLGETGTLKWDLHGFASEISSLVQLSITASVHLVRLFGFGFVEDNRLSIATEYCEGGSLESALKSFISSGGTCASHSLPSLYMCRSGRIIS